MSPFAQGATRFQKWKEDKHSERVSLSREFFIGSFPIDIQNVILAVKHRGMMHKAVVLPLASVDVTNQRVLKIKMNF